ncbi:hypothetical protein BJ085DRAFT_3779, partial [Dimargaris cristalligena]
SGPSQLSGNVKCATGTVKETVGHAVGNPKLAQAGSRQRAEGNVEYEAAKAQAVAEGMVDKTKGVANEYAGKLTGDNVRELSGKADRAQGEAKVQMN